MSSMLRSSLPFTLAATILVYLVFSFLPEATLSIPTAAAISGLFVGIVVPILLSTKTQTVVTTERSPASVAPAVNKAADSKSNADYQGETTTLYVGNLPYRANEDAVKTLFQEAGIVVNVRLMKDRQTGRRRGFGFVEVASKDAERIIARFNDAEFDGRTLKVREAKERQDQDDAADE